LDNWKKNGYIYLEPQGKEFEIKIPLPVLYHISELLKEKKLPHLPILNLDYTLTWEENEISDLQLMVIKIWNLGDKKTQIDLSKAFGLKGEKLVEPLKNWNIYCPHHMIKSFQQFYDAPSPTFLNGKGSPWGDSGLKLNLVGKNSGTLEDFFYIIIQSKRKESSNKKEELKTEWKKIYEKNLDEFMMANVLFVMISDGDEITDKDDLCNSYNCLLISKKDYMEKFSTLFSTLKGLKKVTSKDSCRCKKKKCQCKRCDCRKKGTL